MSKPDFLERPEDADLTISWRSLLMLLAAVAVTSVLVWNGVEWLARSAAQSDLTTSLDLDQSSTSLQTEKAGALKAPASVQFAIYEPFAGSPSRPAPTENAETTPETKEPVGKQGGLGQELTEKRVREIVKDELGRNLRPLRDFPALPAVRGGK